MRSLIVRMKVFPVDVGIDLNEMAESIRNHLPKGMEIVSKREEPIAFGLSALIIDVKVEERDGVMDALEEAIKSSKYVSEVQTVSVSRYY
ncbi:MAG: elongation factor 1-beta [Nitrososphaerota archaeon]|nr:elongation factor 1-beta [Nitrososphaerales archaeon]MDW8044661.1 elongation factor 1-beta [Nitrososphaerota archaeon]